MVFIPLPLTHFQKKNTELTGPTVQHWVSVLLAVYGAALLTASRTNPPPPQPPSIPFRLSKTLTLPQQPADS